MSPTDTYPLSLHDALPISDEWHDKVDVTSKAFMGLTVGCARCHDHKYDAVYQKDYYGMASVFASSNFKSRSEEHTSELQSQSNLVCRLLLETKKLYTIAAK